MATEQKDKQPVIVNYVANPLQSELPLYSTNRKKLKEFARILDVPLESIPFVELPKIRETQDADPYSVARDKAIEAYRANNSMPVVIEETSLSIPSLLFIESPYVASFGGDRAKRAQLCQAMTALDLDRKATARVILGVWDGKDFHHREGTVDGRIADKPDGRDDFGWDDIFEVETQEGWKRFSFMKPTEKDRYSMRTKALEDWQNRPFEIGTYVMQLEEPFPDEIARVRPERLNKEPAAVQFAFNLETLGEGNPPNADFRAPVYEPIIRVDKPPFYTQYKPNSRETTFGIIVTNVEKPRIRYQNGDYMHGEPVFAQMGPERRRLALLQRAQLFRENHTPEVERIIEAMESGYTEIPARTNRKHPAIERMLGVVYDDKGRRIVTETPALDELGYRKRFAATNQSRREARLHGLYNKVGKYVRKVYGLGSMPPSAGVDTVFTAIVNDTVGFIPRNSIYAGNVDLQIQTILRIQEKVRSIGLSEAQVRRAERNIGLSVGVDDPDQILRDVIKVYEATGNLFVRLYVINADPRSIHTARKLRQYFGEELELWVGKVPDLFEAQLLGLTPEQLEQGEQEYPLTPDAYAELATGDICVDAIDMCHAGGRQCDSAGNRQAVTSLEDITDITYDPRFNNVSLIAEGGVGRGIGVMLMLGIDCVLYNQRLMHGTIESPAGDLFVIEEATGKYVQMYPGSASVSSFITEAAQSEEIAEKRFSDDGRAESLEGAPGVSLYERKANSMAYRLKEVGADAAKMEADLGVHNIPELRRLMAVEDFHPFRKVTAGAQVMGTPYKNKK